MNISFIYLFFADIPVRVNGRLSGKINEQTLTDLDIQSYIVTSDGRSYTAISKMPNSVGFDMQSLNIIGGTIAWLFAKPLKNTKNGYQLTGRSNYMAFIICSFL